ncbi:Anthranilate synthase, aminase component [Candidatus Nitrosotalea sp. TS]|uniref:chorismate-binding protein n=1 Tax=Candidatus Nitrosotalea sp. TS TaxID=2341020 RepID=UPI001EC24B54|nr:chorismate-binding protein [Candidatus Nitrosotalea sp. TS]NHI02896.1 Anthranilate synthase, aminase component [Candidatus Nitrosotalea sp. TS]
MLFNYDAIRLWEKIPNSHDENSSPIMEFGIYNDGILYDNKQKKSFYFYYDTNRINSLDYDNTDFDTFSLSEIKENMDKEYFEKMVKKAKQYIHDGDIFQVVLSKKFNFNASGDLLRVYKSLRQINPSPYLYHIKLGNRTMIGSSPEMLLRVTGNTVETFPIAGTRPITNDEKKNEFMKEELLHG